MSKKKFVLLLSCLLLIFGAFCLVVDKSDFQEPYVPVFIDPCGKTVEIKPEEVPLGKGKVTSQTSTKTSTKSSTKSVKMKTAAKKTYTKKLPTKIKTNTKTTTKKSVSADVQTKVVTKTTTYTTEKYTKKSKTKKVTTKVVTKVTTTVTTTQKTVAAPSDNVQVIQVSAAAPAQPVKKDNLDIRSHAPKMDEKVLSAFETLGFTLSVDSTVNYAGYFTARSRQIIMRREDDLSIYHELGHFLGFIAGNIDRGSVFAAIYQKEKSAYVGFNKAYVTQDASEYFAESVKDYILDNANLKNNRPQTYETVQAAFDLVTPEQISKLQKVYAAIWK